MIAKRIKGANANPGAPRGWRPEQGPCGHLALRVTRGAAGHCESCESAWEPTPDELRLLIAGGHVILYVAGWQPPVMLRVEAQPMEEGQ